MEAERHRRHGFSGEHSIVLPQIVTDIARRDSLVSGLYITDIGYYPKANDHYRERKRPIEQYILIYCVEGCGWYEVQGRRHEVSENEFFILPSGKPHIYAADKEKPWTIYWVHFCGSLAAIFAEGADTPQKISPRTNSRINERNNIFEEIFSTLHSGYDLESVRYASSVFHYYLASLRYLNKYRKEDSEADIIEAVKHYMKENIGKHLTLKEIASYAGYSTTYFATLFKAKTGHSPTNYINILKVHHACRLLETTSLNINQICYQVGIDDCYYFSRLFKKIMGLSPSEYRRREIS